MTGFPSFNYECPQSLAELAEMVNRGPLDGTQYLAGGTDLLVGLEKGKSHLRMLIDIKKLPGMLGVEIRGEREIWIGSLTAIHTLERNDTILSWATALKDGSETLGSWQIRNRATIGGNLANASPTADTASPLLALDARIMTWGPQGERSIPAEEFWIGPGKSSLKPGEMITGVLIPLLEGCSSAYIKLGQRQSMDIAIASAAAVVRIKNGLVDWIRLALGGASPTPIRARSAENYLMGKAASQENFIQAGLLAAGDSDPRNSARATREYRLQVIPVLVQRVLQTALLRHVADANRDHAKWKEEGNRGKDHSD